MKDLLHRFCREDVENIVAAFGGGTSVAGYQCHFAVLRSEPEMKSRTGLHK